MLHEFRRTLMSELDYREEARNLTALAGNDLRLKIEVIDQGSILEGFQKVANRTALVHRTKVR